MKMSTGILFTVLSVMLLAACGTTALAGSSGVGANNPYATQAGDAAMMRGDVRIDSASVSLSKSNPPQAMLHFAYFQPTPCFGLRVEPSQPDAQNKINISAYAVAEKDKACTLMALSTPLQADLNLGSYPKGHYSVWLNGTVVGEFDS